MNYFTFKLTLSTAPYILGITGTVGRKYTIVTTYKASLNPRDE